jgi:SNF2 family DNA or RNA helicase
MQLRKVCNHPDLFEVRPIVTSFAMSKSTVADFEIKELLVRRRLLASSPFDTMHHVLSTITSHEGTSFIASRSRRFLDASSRLQQIQDLPGEPPPHDVRTVAGFRRYNEYCLREEKRAAWRRISYINRTRCAATPIYGLEKLACVRKLYKPLLPLELAERSSRDYLERNDLVHGIIKSYAGRAQDIKKSIDHFAFATPVAVALDLPSQALRGAEGSIRELQFDTEFDTLHTAAVKLQIAFPDAYLLQYDCGKLQELDTLLKERRAGGHRVLIFTQMTKVLDVLEIFLNLHGYRYLRLDGSTKIEDRQKITQRFNMDTRVLAFISSSRSGGVGINLTGADTVSIYAPILRND